MILIDDDKKSNNPFRDGDLASNLKDRQEMPVVVQYFYAPPSYEQTQSADPLPGARQTYDQLIKDNSGYPTDGKNLLGSGFQPYNGQSNVMSQSTPSHPSQSSTSHSRDLQASIKPSPRNMDSIPQLEDPQLASFTRQPPHHLPYPPGFHPLSLAVNGKYLRNGFPLIPPPSTVPPHPFITHDVTEGDWIRFLDDLRKTSTQSGCQHATRTAAVFPITLPGIIPTKKMKKTKCGPAIDLVDLWNHYFFHPRRLEAILMRGSIRLSGNSNTAPTSHPSQDHATDDKHLSLTHTNNSSSSSSSSSSSEDEGHHRSGAVKREYRAGKLELRKQYRNAKRELRDKHRAERKQKRYERKAERKEKKKEGKTFRLLIVPF